MKDDSGRVLVEHFYDDVEPLGPIEKQALAEAPAIDARLMEELWLGSTDGATADDQRADHDSVTQHPRHGQFARRRPGVECDSVVGGSDDRRQDGERAWTAARPASRSSTTSASRASSCVDREPTADERRANAKVAKVVIGPLGVGSRTPMDLPISQEVIRAVESARGRAVKLPTMGGGLPLQEVERPLGTRTIVIPMGNHDNNQHSFDENLRIQNLYAYSKDMMIQVRNAVAHSTLSF